MPAAITQLRRELAAHLNATTGLVVVDHVPAAIVPPLVVLSTGDPYITEGDSFDRAELVAHLELYAIAGTAIGDEALAQLEAMTEALVLATDYALAGVSAPYMAPANGTAYLTARLRLATTFRLTTPTPLED